MKYSYIKQHDERDCGAACLVMLASYYGTKISLAKCREYAKTDLSGTNLYGMIDGADKIGLELTALEGDRAEFKESLQNGEIKTPFIAGFTTIMK